MRHHPRLVTLRRTLGGLSAVALAACAGRGDRSTATSHAWYQVAQTPQIIAYLDTAHIERAGKGVSRIWMRFVYTPPISMAPDTTTYQATETRQELDCANRRTRGLELRMIAVSGAVGGSPTPDSPWTSIDTHPLGSGMFLVACRVAGTAIPAHPAAGAGATQSPGSS